MQLVDRLSVVCILSLLLFFVLPVMAQAQFICITNSGTPDTITITRYTDTGGVVNIPSMTNGLSVTSIGYYAFSNCTSLTSVIIPDGVTNIGNYASH